MNRIKTLFGSHRHPASQGLGTRSRATERASCPAAGQSACPQRESAPGTGRRRERGHPGDGERLAVGRFACDPQAVGRPARRHPLTNRLVVSLLVGLAALLASVPARADILYLNEGEEHVGRLQRITADQVLFTEIDGREMTWPASEVAHILLSQVRPGDEHDRVEKLTDPVAVSILKKLPEASEFPDADFVTLYRNRTFTFQPDGSVVFERRVLIRIFKEPGLDMANMARYYQADRETFELVFAHTYAPDGHVYHLTDDAISEEALYTSTPEYDKLRKTKFALKKVDLGSVIDVKLRITTKPPDALHPYLIDTVFGEREPVLREECVVRFPKEREMVVENLHWDGPNLPTFTDRVDPDGKTRVLTWTFRDPKGFIPEANMPSTSRVFPRTWVYPRDDWNRLGKEFEAALASAAPSPALLDAFIKETGVKASDTTADKVRKIHDAILKKIRLLPVSFFDLGGVAPLPVDVALQKRYGNNQARVCLAHFALKKLGVPSEVGLTSYWNADEIRFESPTLGQAIYAVLRVEIDGRPFYTSLDSDYLPFGHLPTAFQGARAIFLRQGAFVPELLPEGGPANNQTWRTVFAKLDADGSLEVTEIRRPRGPGEISLRTLRAAKAQEKLNFAQNAVKRVHPKAVLTGFTLSDLDDLQTPVALTLRYRIPEAAIKASDRLLAFKNLWVNYSAGSASLATRTWPLEYWATEESVNSVLVELPPGFRWVPWNQDYVWDCGCLSYRSTLDQHGSTLQFADRFAAERKSFPPGELYDHYRGCLLVMANLAKQWIIVERDEPASGTGATRSGGTDQENGPTVGEGPREPGKGGGAATGAETAQEMEAAPAASPSPEHDEPGTVPTIEPGSEEGGASESSPDAADTGDDDEDDE